MAVITRAYSEVDGQIADASSINRVIDDLYTLQNGNINSANIFACSIATTQIEALAVTIQKTDFSVILAAQVFS